MINRRRLLALSTLAVVGGCTGEASKPDRRPATSAPPSTSTSTSTPTTPSTTSPTPGVPHRVSVQSLVDTTYDGSDLRLGRVIARTDDYTARRVTYRGGGLELSGVMNVPRGRGPFPVVVLNHGYIDPDIYVTGQGMRRERDYLAREGYVVLHIDYRGHAQSDPDPNIDMEFRLPYSEDTINSVLAIRDSNLSFLDGERVGFFGRSMGGAVTYNALIAQPGLVRAAVVYAPTSSLAVDNFRQFNLANAGRSALNRRILRTYGRPSQNPSFWDGVSSRPMFDRITEPLLLQHGARDESCPIAWSRATVRALREAGKDVELVTYDDEPHAFGPAWPRSMRRTTAFLDEHVRG